MYYCIINGSIYPLYLKDKIIYCNCDSPKYSNFWKYFYNNSHILGLKGLVSTYLDKEQSYKTTYDGKTVKQKVRETQEEKYGGVGLSSPIIREKVKETNIQRYGVENVFASEEVIEKLHDIREERIEKFEQENDVILGMKLFERFGTGFMQAKIVEPIIYNGSRFYKNSDIPYIEKCCELSRGNVSISEVEIGDFIEEFTNVERNTRKIIPPYELDIFIQDKKLAIEINGIYWHSTNSGKSRDRHLKKTLACNKLGIRLIHINEFEWKNKREICKSILLSALGIYETIINVNDCDIKEVSLSESSVFLDKNHIQGSISSSYQLGVYYKNELVQLVTFNKNDEYEELPRVCTKLNTFVIGGFDKVMKTQPFPVVHYFVDKSKFTCSEYTEHGWKVIGETMPSYVYYKGSECIDKQCEQNLMQLLGDEFNSNETPEQNLVRNGYLQVYDCGSTEVIYRKEAINDNKEK